MQLLALMMNSTAAKMKDWDAFTKSIQESNPEGLLLRLNNVLLVNKIEEGIQIEWLKNFQFEDWDK